jgi:hypothetical protein
LRPGSGARPEVHVLRRGSIDSTAIC